MKTYIVTSATQPKKPTGWCGTTYVMALAAAQKDLRRLVENFAAEHPGQIIVEKEDAPLMLSLKIQAEPAIAEKLSKIKGIGEVSEPRKLTPDSKPRRPSL